jgi:hypothetical protein
MADNINKGENLSTKCIWMDAEIIKYKLCDRKFDCENCLFDKVMRNDNFESIRFHYEHSPLRENDLLEKKISAIKEARIPKGNIYLRNNIMVKKLLGKTYYLGLTPLAYNLLENAAGFNYCRDNILVKTGDPLVQFIGDWGSIKIPSPLNFYCLGRLKHELNDISSKEWFSLIELEPEIIQSEQISEEQYLSNCSAVETIFNRFKSDFPDIGTTLNDGGEKLRYLYQVIGAKRYYTVMEKLFNHS